MTILLSFFKDKLFTKFFLVIRTNYVSLRVKCQNTIYILYIHYIYTIYIPSIDLIDKTTTYIPSIDLLDKTTTYIVLYT